jgi:hypothetical protein
MPNIVLTAGISSSIHIQSDFGDPFAHRVKLRFSKTFLRILVNPGYERAIDLGLLPVLASSFSLELQLSEWP